MIGAFETLVISFLGGVSAAFISHIFSGISDKANRKKKIFDDLFKEVESIVADSVEISSEVWNADGGNRPSQEQELICKMHDISTILSFLDIKGSKLQLRVYPAFANFRRSITGDDFGVTTRKANAGRIVQIRSSAIAFRIGLRDVQYEANRLAFGL